MIRIVTDTTADLPQEIIDEFRIPMAPQYVHFGEESYRDRFDLSIADFFARLQAAREMPKTSAPTVGDFVTLFQQLVSEGPDDTIICIHPSTEVSGTIRSALPAAADFEGADIRIFDTRTVSIPHGMIVWEAARMARDGASADEIMAMLEHARSTSRVYFVVETLEFLAKGGRIGRASHLVGTLLDIKPILTINDGVIESHSRARTRKKSLAVIRDLVLAEAGGQPGLRLGIAHALCLDEANWLRDELSAVLKPEIMLVSEIGSAVGTHAGPGVVAVGWYHYPPAS
jgi:DegV family protein with EDD domain